MSTSKYETVIGLEVHVELHTKTKIFCGCSTEFGAPPNTHTCPVCLGHPGVLPVLNRQAVDYAMKAAMALNCEIGDVSKFDRKNYFYPDSPKAYQISQYDQPIGLNGYIDIEVDGKTKRIGITRLHLEEDAGKLTHVDGGYASLVDFNRVGTPLVEIVSEPDISSPEEARAYLEKLRAIMLYCEVSDVKMEEGSMRCDANISLRPHGQKEFGTRAELKNMNSFRGVVRGLEYEQLRQAEIWTRAEKSCRRRAAGTKRKARPSRCAARKKRMIIATSRIPIWSPCISTRRGKTGSARRFRSCRMPGRPAMLRNTACRSTMPASLRRPKRWQICSRAASLIRRMPKRCRTGSWATCWVT
ncbi:hypothetical protein HMSSN139_63340 [Paenibacillus sp. HMSSN-139]|nr:hypothetical protein HMSSN139_63340 [Paenibacillus sp. HMSSN-139]